VVAVVVLQTPMWVIHIGVTAEVAALEAERL
jgi:hypothetical protein